MPAKLPMVPCFGAPARRSASVRLLAWFSVPLLPNRARHLLRLMARSRSAGNMLDLSPHDAGAVIVAALVSAHMRGRARRAGGGGVQEAPRC